MRHRPFIAAIVASLGLIACQPAAPQGTSNSGTSEVDLLSHALVGHQIFRAGEMLTLLSGGRLEGNVISISGDADVVDGSWSAIGGELCLAVETLPMCGRGTIRGNQLLHYVNGPDEPDVWIIS